MGEDTKPASGSGGIASSHYHKCLRAGEVGSPKNDACRHMIDECVQAKSWPHELVTDERPYKTKDETNCILLARILAGRGRSLASAPSRSEPKPELKPELKPEPKSEPKPKLETEPEPKTEAASASRTFEEICSENKSWPFFLHTNKGKKLRAKDERNCKLLGKIFTRRGHSPAGTEPIGSPDPVASPGPIASPDPVASPGPIASPDPVASPEPSHGIPSGILIVSTPAEARRELIDKDYPSWVIIGMPGCRPCREMKKKMAEAQREGGAPKSRIAYVDISNPEKREIMMELGIYKKYRRIRGVPQLFYLAPGTGVRKPRKALYEWVPQHFKDIDFDALFSGKTPPEEHRRIEREYQDQNFRVWYGIIDSISKGRL